MPSAKRTQAEAAEDPIRDKPKTAQALLSKGKKSTQNGNGTGPKDSHSTSQTSGTINGQSEQQVQNGVSQFDWKTVPSELLHSYRHQYRLAIPSAYKNPTSHYVLSSHIGMGIGKYSPTMARRKAERRVTHEQLATAVRKHFNAMAVREEDVIVETLYTAKHCDKALCAKFPPSRRGLLDSGGAVYAGGHQRSSLGPSGAARGGGR